MSQLMRMVQQLREQGIEESSGAFTLDHKLALKKLSEFTLPRPTAWLSKLVQAAVGAGAPEINIQLNAQDALIRFPLPEGSEWQLDQVESFLNSARACGDEFESLRQALWSAGFNQNRAFLLSLPKMADSIVWSGQTLTRMPFGLGSEVRCWVSHSARRRSVLDPLQASRMVADLNDELRQFAYACPVALKVDGRRFDSLLQDPHLFSRRTTSPIDLAWLELDLPKLVIPPATLAADLRQAEAPIRTLRRCPANSESASAAVLLCLSCKAGGFTEESKRTWEFSEATSQIAWIDRGLVCECERVPISPGPVSVLLFASAAGLPQSVTGSLIQDSDRRARRDALWRAFCDWLGEWNIDPVFQPSFTAREDSRDLNTLRSHMTYFLERCRTAAWNQVDA